MSENFWKSEKLSVWNFLNELWDLPCTGPKCPSPTNLPFLIPCRYAAGKKLHQKLNIPRTRTTTSQPNLWPCRKQLVKTFLHFCLPTFLLLGLLLNKLETHKGSTIFLDASVSPSRKRWMARLASVKASSRERVASPSPTSRSRPPTVGPWVRIKEGLDGLWSTTGVVTYIFHF